MAHHLPARVWTNQDVIDAHGLRLKDAWVRENIGVRERRWCEPGETTSSLAAEVCSQLLAKTGLTPAHVDRLIVATVSPDVPTPSTACVTQSLFAPEENFPAVDVVAACGGFLYALDYGRRCVQTGDERVLVVAAGYDPHEGSDVGPVAGTQLVRVDGSLAAGGLKNSGEPVSLYFRTGDAAPVIVASYADHVATGAAAHAGRSVVADPSSCDLARAWRSQPAGSASPPCWAIWPRRSSAWWPTSSPA